MKRKTIIKWYLRIRLVKVYASFLKQIIDDFFLILFMSWMDSFPLQADKDHTTIQRFFFKLFEFSLFFIAAFYWPLVVIPLLVVLTFEGYIRYRKEEDEKEREAPKKWH